jgi:hypothetical protein
MSNAIKNTSAATARLITIPTAATPSTTPAIVSTSACFAR